MVSIVKWLAWFFYAIVWYLIVVFRVGVENLECPQKVGHFLGAFLWVTKSATSYFNDIACLHNSGLRAAYNALLTTIATFSSGV